MANDAVPVRASVTVLGPGTQSPPAATAHPANGNALPPAGSRAVAAASNAKPATRLPDKVEAKSPPDLHGLVAQLNKQLQSSGRPNYYRLNSSSGRRVIQEVDPVSSKVISEIPASEFKALAQELGISGLLVDAHA